MESHRFSLADLAHAPERIRRQLTATNGQTLTLRALAAEDATALGAYFLCLSADTRRRFGPHPLDAESARDLCQHLDLREVLRLIAEDAHGNIVAYFILEFSAGPHETRRYAEHGMALTSTLDCTLAPSVADAWQSQGLGSPMLAHLIEIARQLGRRYMLLMGGTQCSNTRARHFYSKHGFITTGHYEFPAGVANQDMYLTLQSTQGVRS